MIHHGTKVVIHENLNSVAPEICMMNTDGTLVLLYNTIGVIIVIVQSPITLT